MTRGKKRIKNEAEPTNVSASRDYGFILSDDKPFVNHPLDNVNRRSTSFAYRDLDNRMRNISRILSVTITTVFVLFGLARNAAAQNYCPEMTISIVDSLTNATIFAPDPFPDNNLTTIHYDIVIDEQALPPDKTYNVFTDDGTIFLGDYDFGFDGSNFHTPTKEADGKWHFISDIVNPRRFGERNRAFLVQKHTLNVENETRRRIPGCSKQYEIVAGLSQQPIQCSIDIISDNPKDNTLISSDFGFTVSIKLTSNSDLSKALEAYKKLVANSLTDTTVHETLAEKNTLLYDPFTFVSSDEYSFHVEKGRLFLGSYVLTMEFFTVPDMTRPTIRIPIGSCSSIEFEICAADKPCALPSFTPTPFPTPTEHPGCISCSKELCDYEDCRTCNICRPSNTPPPPFPDMKPICTQLGQGPGSACRQCVEDQGKLWTAIGCVPTNMGEFVKDYVFKFGVGIAGGVAFLYFIYGCFLILTSAGNAERVEEAKSIITSALSGLLLIIFSIVLLRLIGVDILRIPGFS